MEWDGGWTWYRTRGRARWRRTAPLMILHGGPGAAHDYLETSRRWQATGRPCVLYDQIGCGRSEHRRDAPADFWSVELFRRELTALLAHLGIADRYHLLGQSWGGMLGMEHALGQPSGLRSLVIANSPRIDGAVGAGGQPPAHASSGRGAGDARRATRTRERPTARSTSEPSMVFYERHLCRIVHFPTHCNAHLRR